MASFTDTVPQFNPYVQQLPVEAMLKVGMYKQEKYDQGIEKIQGYIDNIAGLDIIKDSHKAYLQSKLNELGNNLTKVAAGDFSNFQLVNSVSGMTKQIIKDPVIQTAVGSTAKIRKEQELMEADKKAGKLTPDNQLYWSKQLNSWLEDGDLSSPFSGSYVPNFDVFKFAKETFDAVKPDGMSWDEIYQMGPDGKPLTVKSKDKNGKVVETLVYSPTMTRMEKEGRFPEKVKNTLNQIFSDPRVNQQLKITGEYDYRNYDSDALYNKVIEQKKEISAELNKQLLDLEMKKKHGEDVQKQIDDLTATIKTTDENYDSYANLAKSNPDAVRGQLYRDDVYNRYTSMFGEMKTKQTLMENPAWNQEFKMQQEANRRSEFAQELHQRKIEHADEMQWKQKEYDQRWEIAVLNASTKGKKPGYGEGTGPGDETPEQGDQPSDIDINHIYQQDYDNAANDFMNNSDVFIWDNAGFAGLGKNDEGVANLMKSKGITRPEAIKIMLDNWAKNNKMEPEQARAIYGKRAEVAYNKLSPAEKAKRPQLTDAYEAYRTSRRNWENMSAVKSDIERETIARIGNPINTALLTKDIKPQTITYKGVKHNLSKQDVYDLAVYIRGNKSMLSGATDESAHKAANEAEKRLKAAGHEDLLDAVTYEYKFTRAWEGGPLTAIKDAFTDIGGLKSLYQTIRHPYDDVDKKGTWDQVDKIFNAINNDEFTNGLAAKTEIIKKAYGMKPNLKIGLMTGKKETDDKTLYTINRLAAEYTAGQKQNYSPDFEDFVYSLTDNVNKINTTLSAQSIIDNNGNPQIEIVSYTKGKRNGGMTIQPDEAAKLNIDVNSLYESKDISLMRKVIQRNGNSRTSQGDPSLTSTYVNGDCQYTTQDFPNLARTNLNVKGNIAYSNGLYYPFIYISDGNNQSVRQLPGDPDLQKASLQLRQADPTLAKLILLGK